MTIRNFGAMSRATILFFATVSLAAPAHADEPLSLKDKTVTMLAGAAPGGGTDAFARLAAGYLGDRFPGKPTVVVRNMPGAGGVVAANFFYNQAKPDGLTLLIGSGTESDPLHYRAVNALYDPSKLNFLGGAGRTGTVLLLNKKAAPRLLDKSQSPVTMGALSAIRSGMQMTLWGTEYLGWNTRWVTGYAGNNDLVLALQREEIDMTSLATVDKVKETLDTGRFLPLAQSGALVDGKLVPQPAFGPMPLLSDMIAGKITDPVAQQAFEYWKNITLVGQWLALPPKTPANIVAVYREAFHAMMRDPDFVNKATKVAPDIVEMSGADIAQLLKLLADTPTEALGYMQTMQKKQGLHVAD
jgi:tripartite-type tricarboxylate transporter receptor subunit TctC